ncbi:PAS domain-containing hybrid sensor histidine kinase/response regulator [Alteromonas sp. ASW11-130]|uniref:PAS domain-containing hybrid sensor histidine kinase/response regulator n=1 Tax=Alteromonas sp. ASW11-130 TaxID=3015775 RepID=UPI0022429DD8|nr:ATP-binding protein [Alteromonas sp. ASW11-130]MCW8090789.1 ATP-binding protein [Alteromonas sp. ASW11-130]
MSSLPDLSFCFDNAACGLVITEGDGTIRRVNATFTKWLGYHSDELVNRKKIQELFTIGGRFFHHTHWSPLLQMQGSVSEVQLDLKTRDDQVLPMLVNASRNKHEGQIFDQLAFYVVNDRKKFEQELVSARKKVEASLSSLRETQEELSRNQAILNLAMQSAKMAVWSLDVKSGKVEWNKELQSLLGFDQQTRWLDREEFCSLLHPEDRKHFAEELTQAIENKSNYTVEFRLKNNLDAWVEMEIRGHVSYSEVGKPEAVYGIFMDVSERKATVKKLSELNKKLSLSDRRKTEFLATLSHELRNPLAPIRNVLEIMRLKSTDNELVNWSREIIERHVSHISRLIEDLMEISRVSNNRVKLRRKTMDIFPALEDAIEEANPLIRSNRHELTIDKPSSSIYIDADGTRIVQIFSNLLTNAAKYTPAGGKINITVSHHSDTVIISIKDTGIGIPAGDLTNIFTMFSQLTPALERSQGGLGIGLALVYQLVDLHGGKIEVRSEGRNKGSEFIVRLPALTSLPPPAKIENSGSSIRPNKASQLRVLVIDDSKDTVRSLAQLLEYNGHLVRCAFDGGTGIELAKEFTPHVILSDIGLPDITGYEVAKSVRSHFDGKNLYLVAITGWGQNKDKQLARDAGFDEHITKPVNFAKLKKLLANLNVAD